MLFIDIVRFLDEMIFLLIRFRFLANFLGGTFIILGDFLLSWGNYEAMAPSGGKTIKIICEPGLDFGKKFVSLRTNLLFFRINFPFLLLLLTRWDFRLRYPAINYTLSGSQSLP